ncbi:MAG: 50S ribosomal protein L15 [Smithellaceae bacterium]|nr:50S ribosomal protein L15 [Smithellaceae bacterium]
MNLGSLKPPQGSRKKRKRVGRGDASGHGGTSTRGHKGQKARSGGTVRPGFEGGQMPLSRRVPKRGFRNPFKKVFAVLNIAQLEAFAEGTLVDVDLLLARGLVKGRNPEVKLLARGDISYPLTIKVAATSQAAREKIEAAGGTVIEQGA